MSGRGYWYLTSTSRRKSARHILYTPGNIQLHLFIPGIQRGVLRFPCPRRTRYIYIFVYVYLSRWEMSERGDAEDVIQYHKNGPIPSTIESGFMGSWASNVLVNWDVWMLPPLPHSLFCWQWGVWLLYVPGLCPHACVAFWAMLSLVKGGGGLIFRREQSTISWT